MEKYLETDTEKWEDYHQCGNIKSNRFMKKKNLAGDEIFLQFRRSKTFSILLEISRSLQKWPKIRNRKDLTSYQNFLT